jgi:hypothetical protein
MTDPQFDAALDRFTVPPPSADLAARIIAAAESRANPVPSPLPSPAPPRRRDRRGAWKAVIGVAAFGLMSATAAAAGLFGPMPIRIPVLTAFVESTIGVPPAPKPPAKKVEVKPAAKAPIPVAKAPEIKVPPLPELDNIIQTPEARRAERARQIADRMEQRVVAKEARRAARGLPPQTEAQRQMIDSLRNAKTDEERKAALKTLREAHQARRAERARKMGIDPATLPPMRSAIPPRSGMRGLTPEERMERRRQFREERAKRLERMRELQAVDPADLRDQSSPVPPPVSGPVPPPAMDKPAPTP